MTIRLLQALPNDLEYRDYFENFGRKCVGCVILNNTFSGELVKRKELVKRIDALVLCILQR